MSGSVAPDVRFRDAVRFLLELALLVAAAWWGAGLRWWWAVLAPVAVATVWGRWVAPKARGRLADPARLALEASLFVLAGVGLAARGTVAIGACLALAGVLTAVWVRR